MKTVCASLLAIILLSAGRTSPTFKFQGKDGLLREYSFTYVNGTFEVSGEKKIHEERKTSMRIVTRILSTDQDGNMDIEADFDKVSAYVFKKKVTPTPFFPSISFTLTPNGDLRDIKPVNPFDVSPGSALPPYKEYMGSLEFPHGRLEVGDSWQYDNKALLPFNVIQNVMITATYKGTGQYQGKKCALIETRYKTQVIEAPSPAGIYVTGTSQRRAESCFDVTGGELLRMKGESAYNLFTTKMAATPSAPPSPPVLYYIEEKFVTSLIKTKTE